MRDAAVEAGRNAADRWEQAAIGDTATGDAQATSLVGIDDGDSAVLDLSPR